MKNFLTSMLGALFALVIFFMGGLMLMAFLAAVIAAVGPKTVPVGRGSYLVFDLSRNLPDAPPAVDFGVFGDHRRPATLPLRTVIRALRTAAKDDRIAGVFITGSLEPQGYGAGFAALKEVRDAIASCRAAGKPVIAWLDFATTRDIYLSSAASDVALDPYGAILLPGLASEPMFFAGAFDKFGIGVQVTRVGKYKSAIEPYTRQNMSPESREQTQKLLDDLWGRIIGDIAASRGVTPAQIQAAVDANGLFTAGEAKTAHLVDRVIYRDEIIAELRQKTGRTGPHEVFKQISLDAYAATLPGTTPARRKVGEDKDGPGKIALVYAEGDIVDGEGQDGEVGGDRFARELRKLRQDDSVKAIVLRVNSPGGSATAAEAIQRELRLARATKPVIVSMGTVAASGGYWISAYGDRIFAEPTTITGSIGVFGMYFNVQKLAANLGLDFDVVKTGKFADMLTISRPKTDGELALFQHLVDWIYGQFIAKVAEGRHLDRAKVEEIAQGRVWSGEEARKLGLVDEIGGLGAAMKFAAKKAGLGDNYGVTVFPAKKELAEVISDYLHGEAPDQAGGSDALSRFTLQLKAQVKMLGEFNDPRGVYARLPLEISVK